MYQNNLQLKAKKADSSLKTHIEILQSPKQFISKILYSLTCISNGLSYTNSNRHNNIEYVLEQIQLFIALLKERSSISMQLL
jgi:hypothetical protein